MFKTRTHNHITNEEPPPAYSLRDNLQQKLITDLQLQIARLNSENFDLEKKVDKAYAKNDHLSVINTKKSSEYNRIISECKFLREELLTKTDRVSELEKRIYELIHTISNTSKEIEELKSKLSKKNFIIEIK